MYCLIWIQDEFSDVLNFWDLDFLDLIFQDRNCSDLIFLDLDFRDLDFSDLELYRPQVLLYFRVFTFMEVLREFAVFWFNFDIWAVTVESSTQFVWAMANINNIMLCGFCSVYGVSGVAFIFRCKRRFFFVSLLVIEFVLLIAEQSLQPLPRLDEHEVLQPGVKYSQ